MVFTVADDGDGALREEERGEKRTPFSFFSSQKKSADSLLISKSFLNSNFFFLKQNLN